jgi:hypothetical protein
VFVDRKINLNEGEKAYTVISLQGMESFTTQRNVSGELTAG